MLCRNVGFLPVVFPDLLETVVGVGDFLDCGGGVFRCVGGPEVGSYFGCLFKLVLTGVLRTGVRGSSFPPPPFVPCFAS